MFSIIKRKICCALSCKFKFNLKTEIARNTLKILEKIL